MSYNEAFEDVMDSINNIAQGYGFKNGISWAEEAKRKRVIDHGTFKKFQNAHNLRIRFSHGNARDIAISYQTYQIVKEWESIIQHSSIRQYGKSEHDGYNEESGESKSGRTFHRNKNNMSRHTSPSKDELRYQVNHLLNYGIAREYNDYTANMIAKAVSIHNFERAIEKGGIHEQLYNAVIAAINDWCDEDLWLILTEYGFRGKLKGHEALVKEVAKMMIATQDRDRLTEILYL